MRSFIFQILLFFFTANTYGQAIDTLAENLQQIPDKFYAKVEKKYSGIENKLSRKSVKYLKKLKKQESKIALKLRLLDAAKETENNNIAAEKYNGFIKTLSSKSKSSNVTLHQYNSFLDTLATSLSFLKKFAGGGAITNYNSSYRRA